MGATLNLFHLESETWGVALGRQTPSAKHSDNLLYNYDMITQKLCPHVRVEGCEISHLYLFVDLQFFKTKEL